ncbi:hypothetical protein Dsin_014560 [Dipteronia sinensis]|uniref:Disease resistance R13L4/SHOC-2-like LRR domain-containing protein n=1 Tax=Dipteronia sinensis TaxID=43782 RepID=A0AAE0AN50_9ROSI|nr:hypothetical protein Dsin_014560 [Dipteronia sinensis]
MPSVLYDVFSPKAEAVGSFNHQLHSSVASTKQSKYTVRRWAAYMGIKNFPSSFLHFRNLRSYIAFDTRTRGTPAREIGMCLNKIISNRGFGLLNVLDLEGVYKPKLFDPVIGNLLQLSYLGLRSTFKDNLFESLGYLTCLETLDVRKTNVSKITLWNAEKLRHLYLNRNYSSDVSFNFGDSNNLQTLWGLQVIYKNYMVTINRKLTRLRKLQLSCQNSLLGFDEIALWISQLTELQSLKLRPIESAGQVSYIRLHDITNYKNSICKD